MLVADLARRDHVVLRNLRFLKGLRIKRPRRIVIVENRLKRGEIRHKIGVFGKELHQIPMREAIRRDNEHIVLVVRDIDRQPELSEHRRVRRKTPAMIFSPEANPLAAP
jgi:hypothetical protein